MKKSEVKVMENRLEYLKDRARRQSKVIELHKKGMEELQTALAILLKQVVLEYGGEEHTIVLRRRDDLAEWAEEVSKDEGTLTIKLKKKEA